MNQQHRPTVAAVLGFAFGAIGGMFGTGHPLRPTECSRRYRMNKLRGRTARRRRYGPLFGPGSKWESGVDRALWLGANGPGVGVAE